MTITLFFPFWTTHIFLSTNQFVYLLVNLNTIQSFHYCQSKEVNSFFFVLFSDDFLIFIRLYRIFFKLYYRLCFVFWFFFSMISIEYHRMIIIFFKDKLIDNCNYFYMWPVTMKIQEQKDKQPLKIRNNFLILRMLNQ